MIHRPLLRLGFVACLAALACNALSTIPAPTATPQPSLTAPSATSTPAATPMDGPPPTPVPLPEGYPSIARRPAPASWSRSRLSAPPVYDPANTDPWQIDLRAGDASGVDLRDSLDELLQANFDTTTRWPAAERMPAGFDPEEVLALGMNPGLGLRALHAQGITGRNVGIAIIDQTLLVDHTEYADRLQLYEETDDIRGGWLEAQMHGPAVASFAVGRTSGVAPEADLYYIASAFCSSGSFESVDFACLARSVERILAINAGLPVGRKIRVLSMSIGWSPDSKGYQAIQAAAQAALDAGLLVICSSVEEVHGFRFHGLGRDPLADPDDPDSYRPGQWWAADFYSGQGPRGALLVPMDSRSAASPHGPEEYVFYRAGGWSWSIPYIAGMYALAAQVRPDITPDVFWSTALSTGTTIEIDHDGRTFSLGPILNPKALIAALRAP